MYRRNIGSRWLSLIILIAILAGLVPSLAVIPTEAADTTSSKEAILADLKESYASLTIPKTQFKSVIVNNDHDLEGTYFMVVYGGSRHRLIDTALAQRSHIDRLNANCYSDPPKAATSHSYYPSLWVTISNGEFAYINDFSPENLLDYAVEFRKNTVSVTYNSWYSDGGNTGWESYTYWEYNRGTLASGTDKGPFGPYLGINGIMSSSDVAYNIISLNPNRAAAPWMGTYDTWGNAGYRSDAMPIFIKPNQSGGKFKMYKVDHQNASNCYTYWLGVDEYYSGSNGEPLAPIAAHTISQIVREDKNQNVSEYPGHNANKFAMDWELYQVSPLTLELYKSLYKVKSYVMGENAAGLYNDELYLTFLQSVQQAMQAYDTHRTTFDTSASATRQSLDTMAKDIVELAERMAMDSFIAEPLQITIDYGKSVEFTEEDIQNCLYYVPFDATVSCAGFKTEGVHGNATIEEPTGLVLVQGNDTLERENGLYELKGEYYRFTPKGTMNHIDQLYAVLCLRDTATGINWYLTVRVDIVPATMMYLR